MTTAASPVGAGRLPRWVHLALWLALTGALVAAVPSLEWRRAWDVAARAQWQWMAAAVVANAVILPLWAAEWLLLARAAVRVAFGRMLEIVCVTGAVLNTIPFFAGELSGVALLITRAGMSRGAAISLLAMDQLLVGVAKLAVLAAAAVYAPLPGWLRAGLVSLIAAVGALLVIMVSLALGWTALRDRMAALPERARAPALRVVRVGEHLTALRQPRIMTALVSLALAKKAAELAGIVAIQMAVGLEPSVGGGLLVMAALAVTTLVPVAPANLGVYEATVFAAYRVVGVPTEAAIAVALLQHFCFLIPPVLTGYLALTLRPLVSRAR